MQILYLSSTKNSNRFSFSKIYSNLAAEWALNKGELTYGNSEAQIVFKAGKNCDGYFTAKDLLLQIEKAVDIFESSTNGTATGLFIFHKITPQCLVGSKACRGSSRSMGSGQPVDSLHSVTASSMRLELGLLLLVPSFCAA